MGAAENIFFGGRGQSVLSSYNISRDSFAMFFLLVSLFCRWNWDQKSEKRPTSLSFASALCCSSVSCSCINITYLFIYLFSYREGKYSYSTSADGHVCSNTALSNINTQCSEKNHPLTFSSISLWNMFGFMQNFLGMFKMNLVLH